MDLLLLIILRKAIIIFWILFPLLMVSCGIHPGKIRKLQSAGINPLNHDTTLSSGNSYDTFSIQYLGCGGVFISKGEDALLIDPFFSHQKISRIGRSVFFSRKGKRNFSSRPDMVDLGLRSIKNNRPDFESEVRGIFSAHSHYDHLMDVPAVFNKFEHRPKVYLNRSGYYTCFNVIDTTRMVVLEDHMTTRETVRPPIELAGSNGRKILVYPILADHNPHFRNIKFFSGHRSQPLPYFNHPWDKTRANDWLEGNTFSFLIDYLNASGAIDLRLFIQSSSCDPEAGIPPAVLRQRPVDVAMLGVVSYHFSPDYPCTLIESIKPSKIIWIHWEDFFRSYTKEPKTVRGTDVAGFFEIPCVKAVKASSLLPSPGTVMKFD